MPIENIADWAKFGLEGLVIAALFGFVVYVVKEHRSEREAWLAELGEQRKEWMQAYTQQTDVIDCRQKETNEILRQLSQSVAESNLLGKSRNS